MLLKQKVFYNRARKTKRGLPMQALSYYQGGQYRLPVRKDS